MAFKYQKKYTYFISGKVKCIKKDNEWSCTLIPEHIPENELKNFEKKYIENQRKKSIYLGDFETVVCDGDVSVSGDKIDAVFYGNKKRVCVSHGKMLLKCGLTVEEKS